MLKAKLSELRLSIECGAIEDLYTSSLPALLSARLQEIVDNVNAKLRQMRDIHIKLLDTYGRPVEGTQEYDFETPQHKIDLETELDKLNQSVVEIEGEKLSLGEILAVPATAQNIYTPSAYYLDILCWLIDTPANKKKEIEMDVFNEISKACEGLEYISESSTTGVVTEWHAPTPRGGVLSANSFKSIFSLPPLTKVEEHNYEEFFAILVNGHDDWDALYNLLGAHIHDGKVFKVFNNPENDNYYDVYMIGLANESNIILGVKSDGIATGD